MVFSRRFRVRSKIQNELPVDAIQVTRGLVRHQDRRLGHERASQRHALLLTPGKLDRIMIQAVAEADAFEQLTRTNSSGSGAAAQQFVGQEDVLFGGERGNQLVTLKDESDLAAADHGELVFAEAGDIGAVQHDAARGDRVEAGQQTEQRALAAAGSAHDGHELSGWDLEVDSAENLHAVRAGIDNLGEVSDCENRHLLLLSWF